MLRKFFKITVALAFAMVMTVSASASNEIVILHTNDSHCNIENGIGFAGVAAYTQQMKDIYGDSVVLVDAGDAIQGASVGSITQGSAIIEIMNQVGYDYFVLGNHEFDYQVPRMMELMDMFDTHILSANFVDLETGTSVYDAYDIQDYNGTKIAFIGLTTPETLTNATPTYFQDENGNFIYGFCEDETGQAFYDVIQQTIDTAIEEGADYVVGIGHLGIEDEATPWRSIDVINNTTGFDILIDGHSHTEIIGEIYEDASGNEVLLCQTGEKLNNIGKITIDTETGEIVTELISGDDFTEKDADVQAVIDKINDELNELLQEVVAQTDVKLVIYDPETGERLIRSQETNLGNLVADAYRIVLGADIGLTNAGGVRAEIEIGDITYSNIIEVNPYSNDMALIEVTGQTVLDALEMGAKDTPNQNSGFLSVSGLTYTIDTSIESSIVTDDKGMFVSCDGEYRVTNVMVGGIPLDLEANYTVASSNYLLLLSGDGMTMFADGQVINDSVMTDSDALITYITENLSGVVGEQYYNVYGEGRITVLTVDSSEAETTVVPEETTQPEQAVVVPEELEDTQETEDVVIYTIIAGDNLWKIAKNMLGSGDRYNEIFVANQDIIKNANLIYIGQEIVIPNK
ncbi:MAG: 5'-nucleotidase C-terminal domain-containing protein [Clostridia bacterium]